eukprot:1094084-Prymnesium_polylepis.1
MAPSRPTAKASALRRSTDAHSSPETAWSRASSKENGTRVSPSVASEGRMAPSCSAPSRSAGCTWGVPCGVDRV